MIITIKNISITEITSEGKLLITTIRNIIITKITCEGKFVDQYHLEARRCGFEGRRGRCRGGSDLIFS